MHQIMTGGCQCGAVRFRARSLMDNPHVCHCRMCQKAVGGFFAALVGVPKTDLTWTAGEPAVFEREGVERGFCRDCGTPLFFHRTSGGHVSLCIAAFDEPAAIPLVFETASNRACRNWNNWATCPNTAVPMTPRARSWRDLRGRRPRGLPGLAGAGVARQDR